MNELQEIIEFLRLTGYTLEVSYEEQFSISSSRVEVFAGNLTELLDFIADYNKRNDL